MLKITIILFTMLGSDVVVVFGVCACFMDYDFSFSLVRICVWVDVSGE